MDAIFEFLAPYPNPLVHALLQVALAIHVSGPHQALAPYKVEKVVASHQAVAPYEAEKAMASQARAR